MNKINLKLLFSRSQQLMNTIPNQGASDVLGISLQPGSNGNVFAAVYDEGALRVYDVRKKNLTNARNRLFTISYLFFIN